MPLAVEIDDNKVTILFLIIMIDVIGYESSIST